jgi:hypothetical protein
MQAISIIHDGGGAWRLKPSAGAFYEFQAPGSRVVVIFGNTSNESQLRPIVAMLHCY